MFESLKHYLHRYFVSGMSAMALGLFSSLIINLIISQIAKIPGLDFLNPIAEVFGSSSPVVGAAIGVAVSWGLKAKPLVMFSCAAAGAFTGICWSFMLWIRCRYFPVNLSGSQIQKAFISRYMFLILSLPGKDR